MKYINFLYHAGFIDDDGTWDERAIWAQEDNFDRLVQLVVSHCNKQSGCCDLTADWEAVAADQAMTIAMLKVEIAMLKEKLTGKTDEQP